MDLSGRRWRTGCCGHVACGSVALGCFSLTAEFAEDAEVVWVGVRGRFALLASFGTAERVEGLGSFIRPRSG